MFKIEEVSLFKKIGGRQEQFDHTKYREEESQEAEMRTRGAKHIEAEEAQGCKCDNGEHDLTNEIFYFATHFENSFYIIVLIFELRFIV